jgi:hypothetical protein
MRPEAAGSKRESAAATVRTGREDLPDLESPLKLLVANDQKPQSPSGTFATNRWRR